MGLPIWYMLGGEFWFRVEKLRGTVYGQGAEFLGAGGDRQGGHAQRLLFGSASDVHRCAGGGYLWSGKGHPDVDLRERKGEVFI